MLNIAIIGPKFFGYTESIRNELARKGYQVNLYDEFHSHSIFSKIFHRIGLHTLFSGGVSKHHAKLLLEMINQHATDLFLMNPEVVGRNFIVKVKQHNIKVHLYMWDAVKNKNNFLKYIDLVNSRSSFDPIDCQRFGMTYIGLFSDQTLRSVARQVKKSTDIVFYGTLHSDRAKVLNQVKAYCKANGLSHHFFLYYYARWLFYIKCLLSPKNISFIKDISYKHFSRSQIDHLIQGAKFVLDLHHPNQHGLTMRTFEVLFSGARLITFNALVSKCLPKNLLDRVLIINEVSDLYGHNLAIATALEPLDVDQKYYLSVERFVDELLLNANKGLDKNTRLD